MQKYLFLYALLVTALLAAATTHYRTENQRLANNQSALSSQLHHYRTQLDEEAASAQVLRLKISEYKRLRATDAARIEQLGIRLRRVTATSQTAIANRLEWLAPLRDTIIIRSNDPRPIGDTQHLFRWNDRWVTIEGVVAKDSIRCRIESIDTLRQVVHRIPRRFLFIRWGTRALRQEIISSNPHTKIVYTEYVELQK